MNASTNRKHNRFQQRWIGVWHGKKRRRLLEGGGDAAIAARYLIPFSARLSKHRIKRLEHVRRAKTGYTRGSVTNAGRYKIISLLVTGHGDWTFCGVEHGGARVCLLSVSIIVLGIFMTLLRITSNESFSPEDSYALAITLPLTHFPNRTVRIYSYVEIGKYRIDSYKIFSYSIFL